MQKVDVFLKNPKRALFSLAWPVMLGMLVQVLYNVVDTAFVGRLGPEAIAALTFSFPLFFLLMAINSGIGTGTGSRISRYLGEGKFEEAENTAMHGLAMSVILAIFLLAPGYLLLDRLFSLFGAAGSVLTLAKSYMNIILLGIVFMFPAFVLHSIFTSQGDTRTPVVMMAVSLGINIVLDPIFIFALGLGVAGAAIATTVTFVCALTLGMYLVRKKSRLRFRRESFVFSGHTVWGILKVGFPASLMMLLMSIYVMFINRFMAHYGTEYVASFGLASRLEVFAGMPIMAFSLALMTLTGMFYGRKEYAVMKSTVRYAILTTVGITAAVGVVFFLVPGMFLRIFTGEPELIRIGSAYMRVNVFTFPLMAVGMCTARVMQAMGFGVPGLVTNLTRIVFVAVPLAWVFVFVMDKGYLWVAYAMVIGGIASNIVGLTWLSVKFRRL